MLRRLLGRLFHPIPRADGVSTRAVVLGFGGRFSDEVLSGLPDVLMPTMRAQLGLSYAQVGLLGLSLDYVAAVAEPINGLLIDLWPRRRLLAFGAAGIGLSVIVMGLAPTFIVLLLGFAIYGLASGPLAHTADVVLVEAHPAAPDRIYARSNFVDTIGALLAPLAVTISTLAGMEWRWLMVISGSAALVYAVLLARTHFPPPGHAGEARQHGYRQAMSDNIRRVLRSTKARRWLLFLFMLSVQEVPRHFTTIWLAEEGGMSQAMIGVYRVMELVVAMISLLFLDRWRGRVSYKRVIRLSALAVLLIYPAWLLWPGLAARFLWGLPLTFFLTVFWPIGKAQSLASVPGRAGTVLAVQSLLGLIPISLVFGLLAEAVALTPVMLVVTTGATLGLLVLVWWLPD